MNVETPHLSLEELLAEINGDSADERAWAHLTTCGPCRTEAERWGAVAAGVRQLVAATPSPSPLPDEILAGTHPGRPSLLRREGLRALAGTRPRRVLVAAAAAVVVAAGGAAYGLTAGLTATNGSAAPAGAGLTAVNGCSALVATSGILEQLNGTSLVIKTSGGKPVTVTTSASTKLSREVTGSPSAITDGAQVIVHGTGANGSIVAKDVSIGVTLSLPKPPKLPKLPWPRGPEPKVQKPHPRTPGIATGTVTDASAGHFTLVRSNGTRIAVTTSSATVFTMATASLSQFQPGEYAVAVGAAGPNGTLAATTVEQGSFLPQIPRSNGIASLPPMGCSSSAVATAALLSAR